MNAQTKKEAQNKISTHQSDTNPEIDVEETPNPETRKFLPGCDVSPEGPLAFPDAQSAERSPFALKLFEHSGVASVFLGYDFVSVTKKADISWSSIENNVQNLIQTAFKEKLAIWQSNNTESVSQESPLAKEGTIERDIQDLLNQRVRPFVAQDGGDITFERFEDGVVYLKMRGACQGCPSATATLKQGVENMLRHFIPEVKSVESVA